MRIKFKESESELQECLEEYLKLDEETRLTMSQYDLAKFTEIQDSQRWIAFLSHPQVSEAVTKEFALYTEAQKRKLVSLATTDHRSTGAAQMISALGKTNEDANTQSGEIFIYSYVPLNAKEKQIPGVQAVAYDIFNKGDTYAEVEDVCSNDDYMCSAEQSEPYTTATADSPNSWARTPNFRD